MRSPEKLSSSGIFLVTVWLLLLLLGLMMTISAPSVYAQEQFGDALFFFKRQLIFSILGGMTLYLFSFIPYRLFLYPPVIRLMFIMTTAGLILVLFLPPIRNVHRWIHLGPFTFQPSELAKGAIVLYIAYQAHRLGTEEFRRPVYGIIPTLLITFFWGFLILKEPDLGNTAVFLAIAFSMLILGGVALKYFFIPLTGAIIGGLLLIASGQLPQYWMERIHAYLDPEQYALTIAYQRIQALIALGHGGFFGVGYGRSLQKLYYLPEAHHDYVFAILGEEFGFIGTLFVLSLYTAFFILGLKIARRAQDFGGRMLGGGITLWISLQALTNISIVTGLLPPKGLVLPFISYGGTALLLHTMGIGILLSLDRYRKDPIPWLTRESFIDRPASPPAEP